MNKILLVFILLYNALVYADNRHPLIITDVQSKAKFNDYWKVPRARGEHMQLVFMSLGAATNPSQELVQVAQDFDQIMYVVEGKASLDLSGEISQVKGGDMIIIPAGVVYHLQNLNPNTDVKLINIYGEQAIPDRIYQIKADEADTQSITHSLGD